MARRKGNTAAVEATNVNTATVEAPQAAIEGNAERKLPTNEEMIALGHTTKSARIRHLASLGATTRQIADTVGVIYQHARNVLKQELKGTAKGAKKATETEASE